MVRLVIVHNDMTNVEYVMDQELIQIIAVQMDLVQAVSLRTVRVSAAEVQ